MTNINSLETKKKLNLQTFCLKKNKLAEFLKIKLKTNKKLKN